MLPSEYLSEKLTPHPLPTKDGGVLRTIGDARAYVQALSKTRKSRAHWKRASLLLLQEVGAAALTRQVQVALFMDGKLDPTFQRMSNARATDSIFCQAAHGFRHGFLPQSGRTAPAKRSKGQPGCAADFGDVAATARRALGEEPRAVGVFDGHAPTGPPQAMLAPQRD